MGINKKLVLIDGHSILNRAFFGLPDLTNSEGVHTNAVYGFLNILFKILEEEQPDYLTVAFDVHAPTFRHKMFEGYKGTRGPMDDALREQVPLMKEMLTAMGVCIVEKEGYEADDLLGTLAFSGEREGMEVSVVSGDRDLLQLATKHIKIRIPKTKKTGTEIEDYLEEDVKARYQVTPKEFIDVKALMGDTADNIPGVPGIGEKTATALIAEYGSIEEVHAHADVIRPPRASKNIVEYWDQAVMSKTLATIITDVPLAYDFADARLEKTADLYTSEAYAVCKRLEFKNMLSRFEVDAPKNHAEEFFKLVKTKKEADEIWRKAGEEPVAFYLIKDAAMAVSFSEEDSYLLVAGEDLAFTDLRDALLKGDRKLVTADLKDELEFLQIHADTDWDSYLKTRTRFFDRTIAAYLLNPLNSEYPYHEIAGNYLGLELPSKESLLGKQTAVQALAGSVSEVLRYACFEAYVSWKSWHVLEDALKEHGMTELMENMEMPLVFVLSDMEKEGICIDADSLKEYGEKLSVSIAETEKKIYDQAGKKFNINSPKQLGTVLFEDLKLPNAKKTKTGYSTAADVLDKLAPDYPVVSDILEYRKLSKLKSTYADGLAGCIDETGKIHTTFQQTVTATGRLSSTEPNLQNIPIRIELGKMIRKVFHPKKGNLFVDSDYSQIELRLLAHMSGDEKLIEAFAGNQDIHRSTASLVFHVPFDEVTDLQRRNAKAVNFGIVYGISAFGLSQDLNIGTKEAQEFIDSYFETYPKIKEFLDKTVSEAKKKGYTKTLFGRIRPVPELSSSNYMQRQFGERVAMNAPIQGTAADIMKIAMIRVWEKLHSENLRSRLILQVHDELLIETEAGEEEQVRRILTEQMQQAAELSVRLEIDLHTGADWYEAK